MSNTDLQAWDSRHYLSWRQKIAYLTYEFSQLEQTPCPVTHHYEPGLYIREMRIPAQTLFLGRAHRHGHECQLLSGAVIHLMPDGAKITVEAPFILRTTPGYHMAFFTLTDIVGRTLHPNPNESRDADALEADIFEPVEDLLALGKSLHASIEWLDNVQAIEPLALL